MGNQQISIKTQIIKHPILRSSVIKLEKNSMKTFVPIIDESEIGNWVSRVQEAKNFNSMFLLNPQLYSIESRSMCGNSCIMKITFPIYPYILMEEVKNRKRLNKEFQENELWYILYALVEVSNHFFSVEGKVGDIRPHNILFNENGELKVIHRFSWPCEMTNFEKTMIDKAPTYLSPEEIDLLSVGKTFNSLDEIKSQSFSIGLTMLSILHLQDYSYLYDPTFKTLDVPELRNILQCLDSSPSDERIGSSSKIKRVQNYSSQILKIIQRMCDPEPFHRLRSIQVFKWLLPYSEQIMDFEPFQFRIFDKRAEESCSSNVNSISESSSQKLSPSLLKKATTKFYTNQVIPQQIPLETKKVSFHKKQEMKIEDLQPQKKPSFPHDYGAPRLERKLSGIDYKRDSIRKRSEEAYSRVMNQTEQKNHSIESPQKKTSNWKLDEEKEASSSSQSETKRNHGGSSNKKKVKKIEECSFKLMPTPKNRRQTTLNDINMISTYSKYPQDDELLKKIDHQLLKSRQMFPK